ncbi:MAG: hypothetical protein HUU57_11935 [Bdellovibrio sp.]|nr:hypothetical protein [Bdellovibrio sp.]
MLILINLLLQVLLAHCAWAGVADIYTSTSKSLYEFIQNKKCGDFSYGEFTGESCKPNSQNPQQSLNDVVEQAFFKTAAEEELQSLQCEISKIDVIQKDAEVVKKIKEDILAKLKPLRLTYEALLKAKFDYLHAEDKANQMRSYAYSSKANEARYTSLRKEAEDKNAEAEQLHAAFEALMQSLWMGNSQTVRSFVQGMMKDDAVKAAQAPASFERKFQTLFSETSKELKSNHDEIKKQDFADFDLKTRSKFSQSAYYAQVFADRAGLSQQASAKLQCRLDAKYVKGSEYLDNTAFAASLFLSGGGAILSKTPTILISTLGSAARAGKIAFNSSRVLLAAGAGASTHLMLEEFDRACASSVKGLAQKNLCVGDAKQISANELVNLEEGNCALSVVSNGLSLVPTAVGLRNIYKNPLNLTRALLKPKVILIDDIDEIKKLDPYQRFEYREDLRKIRSQSGRQGDKHVKELPELKGSFKDAFDGPIEQQKFKTGQVIWQIQRSNQAESGRWFSTSVARSREEAEELFYVEKWGNDRGQMRMYIVKDNFTGYTGKVAGGSGNQLFVPDSVPLKEVLEPLSFRTLPGGKTYSDLSKIPKGKAIEISTKDNDGSLLVQGEFVSFRKGKGEFDSITVQDPQTHSLRTYPFKASDQIVVQDVSATGILNPSSYPERWSREIRDDGPVEVTRRYKDDSGTYVQTTYRGVYSSEARDRNYTIQSADGTKLSFPRSELNPQYSHKLTTEEYNIPVAPLKKGENFLSNLIPGDKIHFKALEQTADGRKVTREFSGEYQGIDSSYIVLKRPDDVAPIYVSQFDVPLQKVMQVKKADSYVVPLDEAKRKWLPENPIVEVAYTDDSGKAQVVRGILTSIYDPDKPARTVLEVAGKTVIIPNLSIRPEGLRLVRGQK